MDTTKKRKRMMKNIRRKRIWPMILSFCLFVFLLFLAVVLFISIIGFIMFEFQLSGVHQDVQDVIKKVESGAYGEGGQGLVGMLSDLELSGPEQIYLSDSEGNILYRSDDGSLPGSNGGVHTFFVLDEDYEIFLDSNPFLIGLDWKVVTDFRRVMVNDEFDFSRFDEAGPQRFEAWIRAKLEDGKYVLYIKVPVSLTYKDQLFIIVSALFIIILAGIPLLLYLFSGIGNLIAQRRLTKLFYFDAVTLGRNWLYFRQRAGKVLKKKRKAASPKYAMVCLHVNKYRNYCTCYGTAEGEKLLERIYELLSVKIEKKGMYARHSDAEFGLLLSAETTQMIEQKVVELDHVLSTAAEGRKIYLSYGICEITDNIYDVDEWYVCASMARPTVSGEDVRPIGWFSEEMKQERLWEQHVEERMQTALEGGEFQVYVQPKYDPVTEKLVGGEALIRWISPVDGFIGPGKFIPIFEKNSFITRIDNFMVSEVAKLQAGWLAEGKTPVPISINLSRAHFADPGLPELVCSLVDAHGVPHDLIELEITESVFFDDKQALLDAIDKLHQMGFEISMDDFGSGYSSLNSLKDLALDVLKLDGEFFRGERGKERGDIVVADAIQLAKHLNMKIVAEGVEQKEQVDFLANMGCDMIQGFYYAKPMPAAEFAERL